MGNVERSQFDRHSRKFFFLFICILVGGALSATEAVLARLPDATVARAGERPFSPARDLVLREYQPNARFAFAPPPIRRAYPGGYPVRASYPLETDADGFILPARVHREPAKTIVFLGGSTTEAMYVDPENRFPHRAAEILRAQLNSSVNGLNAGRSGNNSLHANLLLTGKVIPARPDVVVLMEAVNDLGVLASHGSYWTNSRDLGPVRTPRTGVEPAVQLLRDSLIPHTWRAIKRATATLRKRPVADVGGAGAPPRPPGDAQIALWAEDYEASLRQFIATARAWKIVPVLMTQARLPATDEGCRFVPDILAEAHAVLNARLRQVAAAENVVLIDLATTRTWTREDLYDGLHFNDTGSLAAAEVIAAALAGILRPVQSVARDERGD